MCLKNTFDKWGAISQVFHWGMLLILIGNYTSAYIMQDMDPSPDKWWLYGMHKQVGTTMLLLVALRLWWRLRNPIPKDPPSLPAWQVLASHINIWILYFLLFLFPLSGILMSLLGGHSIDYFGLFTIPALVEGKTFISKIAHESHEIFSYILLGFVGLHILAGAYHHLILKDNVLRRMLPGYQSLEEGV